MKPATTNDAEALALTALAAVLADERLADRFLSLSGLAIPDLRHRAGEREVLAALLRFLEAHEPDLVTIAAAIGSSPGALMAARTELEL